MALSSASSRQVNLHAIVLKAVLDVMETGRGFSSLSLREITSEAGVAPAAFYRHFRDPDELGLALVEGCGLTLRRLLREVRREELPPTQMLRSSEVIYKNYVLANHRYFRFAAGARGGGSFSIRKAIRIEEAHFASDIIDLPPGKVRAEKEMTEVSVIQLRLVVLGARSWQSE